MVIDGKIIAEKILNETKAKLVSIKTLQRAQGKPPFLAGVMIGKNDASLSFLNIKKRTAKSVGIDFRIYEFPENISNGELRKKLGQILKGHICGGMIVELPLPPHLSVQHILNMVPEEKDPDVLSQKSQGTFFVGRSNILPPSAEAVKNILEECEVGIKGKTAAIFGYGLLVGRPVAHWLATQGATVSIINEFTKNPAEISRQADIIVSGVGKANLITVDMIKEGSVVIDFGYSKIGGKISGDVDFENAKEKASFITPPTGGTGPIVVASVIKNFVNLL